MFCIELQSRNSTKVIAVSPCFTINFVSIRGFFVFVWVFFGIIIIPGNQLQLLTI